MNTLLTLSFSVVLFILILRTESSASQFERQKFVALSFTVMVIIIIVGFSIANSKINRVVNLYTLSLLGCAPAFIIARFINYSMNKNKLFHFKLTLHPSYVKYFLILFWLLLIGVNVISAKEISQSEFDSFIKYFVYAFGYSLSALAIIIVLLLDIIQTIRVSDEGLFFDGFLWKWSDFHSYALDTTSKNAKSYIVTLNLAKKVGYLLMIFI